MTALRKRYIIERLLYSKISIGILVILLLLSLNAVWGVYEKYREAAKNRQMAAEENEELQERVAALKESVALLKTERGMEKIIREEFGFAKEGEGVIIIVEEPPQDIGVESRKDGILQTLRGIIKNIF